MYDYLIEPTELVFYAKSIEGFNELVQDQKIDQRHLLETALDIAEEWSDRWYEEDEDQIQGFGSSDATYMIQEFIDDIIRIYTDRTHKTDFQPHLKVVLA